MTLSTPRKLLACVLSGGLALILAACGGGAPDPHDLDREAKPYESVQTRDLSQAELLQHLDLLRNETTRAIKAKEFVEFHHLEAALTSTLEALEAMTDVGQPARAPIATLKTLATQLHMAGHDMNEPIAKKLSVKIDELTTQILAAYRST